MSATNIPESVTPDVFPAFMRASELAERLHIKPKTLADWRVAGTGPEHIKCPGQRLVL